MKKLSMEEQQLILQLIKSCEYYHLNEKQSVECINKILNRNISRRTYYSYKNKLYKDDIFSKLKESIYNSPLVRTSILLLNDNDTDLEVRSKVNKLIVDQFPNNNSYSFQSSHNNDSGKNNKDKLKDILLKINQFKEIEISSKTILNALPKNASIREEFIKCGKDACNLCPHGPYYYAYWKEKTKDNQNKLRKKYLGTSDPRR
ncbi:MAG: hypothetical protein H0X03_09115 [Nitrosopumilus sp.]|nr:hypothetical protein [Nitrosopumilus sp.]